MKLITKILALAIIATFLASIPMVLAENNKNELVKVVSDIRVDTADAKPAGTPGARPSKDSGSYSLTGASWKTVPISIEVDPISASENSVFFSAIVAAVEEWDSHTDANLANPVIMAQSQLYPDTDAPDYVNEIMFGDLSSTSIIAQTSYWYNRYTGEMVDFNIVFNTYFQWGDANSDSALMDIQNIATHEFGHGFGLADLYKPKLSALTMYGYASEGQIDKRTLEAGDIAGIQAIYG